jgi:hypothetical protein
MGFHSTKNYRGNTCKNCEHPLDVSDRFCSNCGQKNTTKRLSLNDFFREFLANFYSYDSKIRKTVTSLFTKPGHAAFEFVEGKRTKYANPFRFYLSVSLIFFILNGFLSKFNIGYNHERKITNNQNASNNKPFKGFDQDSLNYSEQLWAAVPDSIKEEEKEQLQKLDTLLQKIPIKPTQKKKDTIVHFPGESDLAQHSFIKRTYKKWDVFSDHYKLYKKDNIDSCLIALNYEPTGWNRYLYKKGIDSNHMFNFSDEKQKRAFLNYMLTQLPFLLFLAIPFLTLNFSLLYFRMHLNYAEHLVFVFNIMTFVFLIFLADEIINIFLPFSFGGIITLGLMYYFYRSLRNFYRQGRWKTLLKFCLLTFLLSTTASFVAFFMLIFVFLLY